MRSSSCAAAARRVRAPVAPVDGRPRPRDARVPAGRRGRLRLRQQPPGAGARRPGSTDAFDYPGFVPAFIRPQFCEGRGPFRWAALSGDPADILRTDRAVLELFPDDAGLHRWIEMAQARVPFQGLPARICWLGYGERARAGLAFNELVRTRRGRARRSSSGATTSTRARSPRPTARPRRCRRLRRRRRLAAPQRPGEHGGRAPRGCRSTTAAASGSATSQHAGMVVVADGTAARRRRSWSAS